MVDQVTSSCEACSEKDAVSAALYQALVDLWVAVLDGGYEVSEDCGKTVRDAFAKARPE